MVAEWKLNQVIEELKSTLDMAIELDCEFSYVLNEDTLELSVIEYTETGENAVRPDEIIRYKLVRMTD